VARIVTFGGDLPEAITGQSVTLTLADEVDCSRGDVIASVDAAVETVGSLDATLVWMADEAMVPHRSYWLKVGSQTVSASVSGMGPVVDVNTMEQRRAVTLGVNDIGEVEIDLDRAVAAVPYAENRQLGGFILIDKISHATVAAGMVKGIRRGGAKTAEEQGGIVWVSGEGRAAHARAAHERLKALGRPSFVLDEAALRELATGPTIVREVAKLMSAAGVRVFVTVEMPAAEAHPGKQVNADEALQDRSEEWVI
jgi:bifunctional enzyme CysN/CysC